MKLKYIIFTLENCDTIKIDGKYIGYFLADDIRTSISRVACNAINRMDVTYTFAIEIHRDANKERHEFGQEQLDSFKQMTFERLNSCTDITGIEFELYDNHVETGEPQRVEHYDYLVHWTGESDYKNSSQKNYLSKEGNLYIVIAENKDIEDFFDKEEIDDCVAMDFHFDMLDIGDIYGNPDRYDKNERKTIE